MPNARADASNQLLKRLHEAIARDGPMPIDRYMQTCLANPEHGYWQRAASIGAEGDFVTAPEISQVFGELIGLWAALTWESMGRPALVRLVELGPGRGTLMRDALRAARALPAFLEAVKVHLVEMSAPLRALQWQTLTIPLSQGAKVAWHERIDEVPPGRAIVIANEFLDALPIRQLVHMAGVWRERVVDVAPDGGLHFALGPAVPHRGDAQPVDGAVLELRAAEDALVATLASRPDAFAALFIDYGPAEAALGDTLQAVRRHAYADPLADPGTADLTAHVQFAGLSMKARNGGLAADGPMTQAEFLGRLGIAERAGRLMSANPARAGDIETGVQRLISPTGMGGLFKALVVRSPTLPRLAPFG